jgi:hypothetical protein
MRRGELERARELVEGSDELHGRNADEAQKLWARAQTLGTLGAITRDEGELTDAYELLAESAALGRRVAVDWWVGGMLAELAALSLATGSVDRADLHARESLAVANRLGDRAGRVFGVGLLACVAAERGELERAGRLWGAIEDEDAVAPLGGWRRHRSAFEARIRELATEEFERGRIEGREVALEEAVAYALADD